MKCASSQMNAPMQCMTNNLPALMSVLIMAVHTVPQVTVCTGNAAETFSISQMESLDVLARP